MDDNGRGWRGAIERRHARRQAAYARDFGHRESRDRRAQRGWPAVRILLTIVIPAFAVLVLSGSAFDHREATVLRDEGVPAAGLVEKVGRPTRGADYANVRFTTRDGRTVSAKVTVWQDLPGRGDRVTICYAPRNPDKYVQDARVCPDFGLARSGPVVGSAALVLTIAIWVPWLVRRFFRRRSAITGAGGG